MSHPFAETLEKVSSTAPMPGGSVRADTAQLRKARRDMAASTDNASDQCTIQPGHQMAFHWLRSSDGEFGLVSCCVNGEPSALVVAARQTQRGFEIMPLFVALTKGMTIKDPDGDLIYGEGGVA